jgi:hypothetical protein
VNEQQWLAPSPRGGLDYLCSAKVAANRRKAGRRKLRLFVCACARRVWDLIPVGNRKAVELGERLCEGENVAPRIVALKARDEGPLSRRHAATAALACVGTNIWHAMVTGADAAAMATAWAMQEAERDENMRPDRQAKGAEELAQSALLREIVPNPFHRTTVNSDWLTSDVVALAIGIYEERAFDRLPILADALQDAGCDSDDILSHCADPDRTSAAVGSSISCWGRSSRRDRSTCVIMSLVKLPLRWSQRPLQRSLLPRSPFFRESDRGRRSDSRRCSH